MNTILANGWAMLAIAEQRSGEGDATPTPVWNICVRSEAIKTRFAFLLPRTSETPPDIHQVVPMIGMSGLIAGLRISYY